MRAEHEVITRAREVMKELDKLIGDSQANRSCCFFPSKVAIINEAFKTLARIHSGDLNALLKYPNPIDIEESFHSWQRLWEIANKQYQNDSHQIAELLNLFPENTRNPVYQDNFEDEPLETKNISRNSEGFEEIYDTVLAVSASPSVTITPKESPRRSPKDPLPELPSPYQFEAISFMSNC